MEQQTLITGNGSNKIDVNHIVILSLPLFRQLFNELINTGRDMRDRDQLNLYYLPEDEYFDNVCNRYGNKGNNANEQ